MAENNKQQGIPLGLIILISIGFMFYFLYLFGFTDEKIDQRTNNKEANVPGIILSGMIGPLIFGFLDNFGMMVGTEAIEELPGIKNQTSTVKSMLGNTFSDGLGALMGSSISSMMTSSTAYDSKQLAHWIRPLFELFGIVVGCLIPVALTKSTFKPINTFAIISIIFVIFFSTLLTYMIANHFNDDAVPDLFKTDVQS
tara:strand:- start:1014 stop:1607 length:594 start_codon:yes stop_codon:yes gene_type:complete